MAQKATAPEAPGPLPTPFTWVTRGAGFSTTTFPAASRGWPPATGFVAGRCEAVNDRGMATGVAIDPPAPLPFAVAAAPAVNNFPAGGVDHTQLTAVESYSINGKKCLKQDAHDVLAASLTDDSRRWN